MIQQNHPARGPVHRHAPAGHVRSHSHVPASKPRMAGDAGSFTIQQIARATGASESAVAANWPLVKQALAARGITSRKAQIGAIATIAAETGNFRPIPEKDSGARYNRRPDLGNTHPGDGQRFKGRGYIQLTGRYNYRKYGSHLGQPLESNPALALKPGTAAQVFASYYADHGLAGMAERGQWRGLRAAVNGGMNGWGRFMSAVRRLQNA